MLKEKDLRVGKTYWKAGVQYVIIKRWRGNHGSLIITARELTNYSMPALTTLFFRGYSRSGVPQPIKTCLHETKKKSIYWSISIPSGGMFPVEDYWNRIEGLDEPLGPND